MPRKTIEAELAEQGASPLSLRSDSKLVVEIALTKEDPNKPTILLGYSIGSADLPHGRTLHIVASGRTLEFRIDGLPGKCQADIIPLAEAAVLMLTEGI